MAHESSHNLAYQICQIKKILNIYLPNLLLNLYRWGVANLLCQLSKRIYSWIHVMAPREIGWWLEAASIFMSKVFPHSMVSPDHPFPHFPLTAQCSPSPSFSFYGHYCRYFHICCELWSATKSSTSLVKQNVSMAYPLAQKTILQVFPTRS